MGGSSTNKDLQQAINENRFREDLYYRLAVVTIAVPPLRNRPDDILPIAKELLHRYSMESRRKIRGFTQEALNALLEYNWPGNIRELENRVKRAVIMAETARVTAADLELAAPTSSDGNLGLYAALDSVRREYIERALTRYQGNLTLAAASLGLSRPTLYDQMEKVGIRRKT
jgi:two-component system NtrC family response regulator